MALEKLTPSIHDKVWGSPRTEPWLANRAGREVGEIWYSAPETLPLLVKFLFTSERLSVQVHPGDAYAASHGEPRGKTEMWHVLRAEPGATVAIGLREAASGERIREAALSGEIVEMLDWVPARAGDTFFIPAGTIHAIGGGLVLCEVQQLSDVTYRLFDYHRESGRPLHLEDSLAVALFTPGEYRRRGEVVECEYFRAARLLIQGKSDCASVRKPAIYVAISGEGSIAGEAFRAGEAWLAPAGEPSFSIRSPQAAFMVVTQP